MADLSITDHCEFCFNGKEAVEKALEIIEEAVKDVVPKDDGEIV